jgi:hypothetical protein
MRIELDAVPEWLSRLDEELKERAAAGLQAAAMRVVEDIHALIEKEPRPPVDRGAYRAAWKVKNLENGAEIRNTLPYASIIEFGARAENIKIGREMINALTAWVQRKGLAGKRPRKSDVGGRISYEVEARNIAWAIAMSMKRTGIYNGGKGLHILERALENVGTYIEEEVRKEIKRL